MRRVLVTYRVKPERVEERNPLDGIAAFKELTARVRERCDTPPVTTELTEVGAFDL